MPSDRNDREPLQEVNQNQQVGSSSRDHLSDEDKVRFNKLVTKAKDVAAQGKVKYALQLNKDALAIYHSEKLAKRCSKMEEYLKHYADESEEDVDGEDMIHVGNGFYLYPELYHKLYAHQREGVLWMWGLYKKRKGGILGDDMGLGKTIQVISFLSGMFDAEKVHSVLIVLPVAVIVNWTREFEKWAPGIRVETYHGGTKRERERLLGKIHRRGGVVLTSYGMVVSNADTLRDQDGREFVWDFVILDEGHKIKNPSNKCSKGLHSIAARVRIILTGTPIQNNLKEMWALFDWTHQGTLLGSAKTFSIEYEGPIVRARQRDATSGEQRLGGEIAVSLQKIINPYFMRRTKAEVKAKSKADGGADAASTDKAPEMPNLTRKNDLIVWVFLSELQQKIYEDFVNTPEVRELLNSTRSPLIALGVLKKMCDHPRLLSTSQCVQLGMCMDDAIEQQDVLSDDVSSQSAANRIKYIDDEVLVAESGKMVFLIELLDNLKQEDHRCLVFSQSRKMLDIIQKVMTARGHKIARLDGTIGNVYEREEVIKRFARDKSYSVFLLTTQVGGVGLTLTAADRVVIYDPSWNPATDAQAVDRAFRIGQDKNVVIYRLITCGSIEEKIYRRQIFKDSITRLTTGESKNPYRYFTGQQLRDLFILDNPRESTTQQQLTELHGFQRKSDTSLDSHIAFLHSLEIYGISDHDLMFSQEAIKEHDDDVEQSQEYIQQRVNNAQKLINLESDENVKLTQQLGRYPAPEVNKVRPEMRERPTLPNSYQWTGGLREPGSEDLVDLTGGVNQDNEKNIEALDRSLAEVKIGNDQDSMESVSDEDVLQDPRSPTPPPDVKHHVKVSDDVVNLDTPEASPAKQKPAIKSEVITLDTPDSTPLKSYSNVNIKSEKVNPKTEPKESDGSLSSEAEDDEREFKDACSDIQSDNENLNNSDDLENIPMDSSVNKTPKKNNATLGDGCKDLDADTDQNKSALSGTPLSNVHKTDISSPVHMISSPHSVPMPKLGGQSPGTMLKLKHIRSKTPQSVRKKRKSVCYHATPRSVSDDEFDPPHKPLTEEEVVHEQLVFSPRAAQPLVLTEQFRSPQGTDTVQKLILSEEEEGMNEETSSSADENKNSVVNSRTGKMVSDSDSESDSDSDSESDGDSIGESRVDPVVSDSEEEGSATSANPLTRVTKDAARQFRHSDDGSDTDTPHGRISSKPHTPSIKVLNDSLGDNDSPMTTGRGKKTKRAIIESSEEEMEEEERKPLKRRSIEVPSSKVPSKEDTTKVDKMPEEEEGEDHSEKDLDSLHSGSEGDSHEEESGALHESKEEPEETVQDSVDKKGQEAGFADEEEQDGKSEEDAEVADKESEEEAEVADEEEQDRESEEEAEVADEEEQDGESEEEADVADEEEQVEESEEEADEEEQVESEEEADEEEESEEELTAEEEEKYISLMSNSRKLYKSGQLAEALSFALDALEIYSGDERAKAYALKLQHKLNIG